MDNLILDIETIPSQRADIISGIESSMLAQMTAALDAVRAPSNYKDEAKIAEYIAQQRLSLTTEFSGKLAAKLAEGGLDGAVGQVFCVCWAWNDGPVRTACASDTSAAQEAAVISGLFSDMPRLRGSLRLVGHNVAAFDLRFLRQRAIVHGIRLPQSLPFDAKPWDEGIYDTMVQWSGAGKTISMDRLCLALGIEGKGGISGADVWPMVQAGRYAEVAAYCADDVERTRAIYNRMTYREAA